MGDAPRMPQSHKPRDELAELADRFAHPFRSPVLHRPDEAGLAFEDVSFTSIDGVPLEGWFLPCAGSGKLVIANHPLFFSRSGLPSHVEPWKSVFGAAGNDFEVNFIPDLKILHDAGFNVLTYDFRNFGQSGSANGGVESAGHFESRDVLGSLRFVRSDPRTRDMRISLLSRCLGANATMFAMQAEPESFTDIRSLVAVLPLSVASSVRRNLERAGLADRFDEFDALQKRGTSRGLSELTPADAARSVRVPTFVYQVRDDLLTTVPAMQEIFDNIAAGEKHLHWIEGTTRRWDGYCEFQRRPEPVLAWFEAHAGDR